jgi:chemotaxis protein methyltransferase CheR
MMAAQVMAGDRGQMAASLNPGEFAAIADYAKQAFGLHLPDSKREMVFARLIKRLRKVGITDFSTYLTFVKQDANTQERSEFLSALTTNVTQFFRENHHFDYLRTAALPPLLAKAKLGHRVRIWSAGCSAGQEAYSLAMTVLDMCPEAPQLDIKILATDIDPRILDTAIAGRYKAEDCEAIPANLRKFALNPSDNGYFHITHTVRQLISFAELNLIAEWPMRGTFDVIFCRNVAIYFDAETQSTLWGRFAAQLTEGGHLMIGHSERLSGRATQMLRSVGVTAYVKSTASVLAHM